MKDPVTPLVAAVFVIAAASFPVASTEPAAAGLAPPPMVVELFTSQGGDSCPPADAVLGERGSHPDVLPLSFHVTYWDRLGWPDPSGLEARTERQRDYASLLARDVIGGRIDVVGSARERVHEAIELLAAHRPPGLPLVVAAGRPRLARRATPRSGCSGSTSSMRCGSSAARTAAG